MLNCESIFSGKLQDAYFGTDFPQYVRDPDPRPGGDDIQRLVPANMRLSQTYSYNILSVGKLKLQPQDIVPIPKENM